MTLELYINNNLMDIDENTEVSLVKEFQSDEDLERKEVQYSYELELPITIANQKVFGYANSLDVKHKFYQQYDAQLYAEHILVLDGKFMLTEINKDSFVGNIYVPSYKELKDVLGQKKLTEIGEHNMVITDMNSINLINEAALAGGVVDRTTIIEIFDQKFEIKTHYENDYICYPYTLYNFTKSKFTEEVWNEEAQVMETKYTDENGLVQFTDYKNTTFNMTNTYPSFNVLKLIEKLFETYGYKVSGNIFNDKRFTELWMTSNFDKKKYEEGLNYAQYLYVGGHYAPAGYFWTSVTDSASYHEYNEGGDQQMIRYWSDDMFHAKTSNMYSVTNTSEMFHPSQQNNGGSIMINVSGWYLIDFDLTRVDGPMSFLGGGYNVSDRGSFNTNQIEIRLVKGEARTDTNWYSQFGQAPIVPRYNNLKNMSKVNYKVSSGTYETWGWNKLDRESYIRVPKNEGVAVVHSYSNFNTDRFITGFRYGIGTERTKKNYYDYDHVGKHMWVMHALPYKEHIGRLYYDAEDESYTMALSGGKYNGEMPSAHTGDTAVVLMGENVISYNGGYYTGAPGNNVYDSDDKFINWGYGKDGFTNPQKIRQSWAGFVNERIGETDYYMSHAEGKSSCVVWLEQGQTINAEVLMSVDYVDLKRMPNFDIQYTLQMGLVSTDKAWKPEGNNIIPETVSTLMVGKNTNMNQFLPDMTCNDFLEAFMNTFNLRITKIADNEYSINYSDIRQTTLNIVPLDKYLDLTKVVEKSIDLPSAYNFKFTTSQDEEGWVSGDNSMFCQSENKKDNEKPNYDGSKTIETNLNNGGDSVDVESRFSYNWYKTCWVTTKENYEKWIKDGKKTPKDAYKKYGGYMIKVPVIADAANWNKTFEEGSKEADKTSATPRFFYMDKEHTVTIKDGTTDKLMLVVPMNTNNGFDLDFNSIPSFVGIEQSLFSTVVEPSYEVQISLAMSNEDYQKIQQNTLVKINDELYRVVKIDGHSVTGEAEGDLVLKAII